MRGTCLPFALILPTTFSAIFIFISACVFTLAFFIITIYGLLFLIAFGEVMALRPLFELFRRLNFLRRSEHRG